MKNSTQFRSARNGFTLIEIMITVSLVGTFLGSFLLAVLSGSRAVRTGMARQDLEATARRAIDRIASELVSSGASVLSPNPVVPFGSSSLTFQRIDSVDDDGTVEWGTPLLLELELEPGEVNDGLDNDGDGLVDEREVVWTSDPGGAGELSAVWVHHVRECLEGESPNGVDDNGNGLVDEGGLCFVHTGGKLIIRLSLEGLDLEGNLFVRTMETTVRLRN